MHFNVSQLLQEFSGATRRYDVNENLSYSDVGVTVHVWGTVKMLKTDESIWVQVSLDSQIPLECSRCLAQLELPVHTEFDEEYFPISSGYTQERGLGDVDETQYIHYDNILDLNPVAHQYLSMAVPMKPVCEDACSGLCMDCGINLNNNKCQCKTDKTDLRWAALNKMVVATPRSRPRLKN